MGHAEVLQIAGHVHADEHDLEAADKVARHQQQKAGVGPGFPERLAHGLLALGRAAAAKAGLAQAKGQGGNQQREQRQYQQGIGPAELRDQLALHGHHEELAERARRRGHAHGPAAPRRRNLPAQHAVDHGIGGAGLGRADQHAGGQQETPVEVDSAMPTRPSA
jgi:hypothetical protein